jgi:predicted NodU family carbamoyl transferase
MSGNPMIEAKPTDKQDGVRDGEQDAFQIHWDNIEALEHPNQFKNPHNFGYYANLASSVQSDLEECTFKLLGSLKALTDAKNLVLVGGVALNSVLNGKSFSVSFNAACLFRAPILMPVTMIAVAIIGNIVVLLIVQ